MNAVVDAGGSKDVAQLFMLFCFELAFPALEDYDRFKFLSVIVLSAKIDISNW